MTRTPEPRPAAGGAGSGVRARVPDFFVLGHPKSGTTALYEMLRRHPQVYMPEIKEPRFFGRDLYAHTQRRAASGPPDTLEEYLALFAPAAAGQLAGEASPMYLASREAAGRIAELQPDARLIAILREPASFLRSLHLQFVEMRIESVNDLGRAMALEDRRRRGEQLPAASHLQPQALLYADYVRYVDQLRRYRDAFPAERLLVLVYEDFRADNEAALGEVLRFLGLDDEVAIETVRANPTVRVRSQPLHELMHAVSVGRGPVSGSAKAAVKRLAPRRVRHGAMALARRRLLQAEPRPADEQLMLELRRRFRPEVEALGDYLGRDLLAAWGYDELA